MSWTHAMFDEYDRQKVEDDESLIEMELQEKHKWVTIYYLQ